MHLIVWSIIICICLMACFSGISAFSPNARHDPSSDGPGEPDVYGKTGFRSLNEMSRYLLSAGGSEGRYADTRSGFVHPYITHSIQNGGITMPFRNGSPIRLRNAEGYPAITTFESELYGQPWIWFHSGEGSDSVTIKMMYMDAFDFAYESLSCSEVIGAISPDFPNIDSICSASSYADIYESEMQLEDRLVSTLVYDVRNDERQITTFLYDNMLVKVVAKPHVADWKWFQSFSIRTLSENIGSMALEEA